MCSIPTCRYRALGLLGPRFQLSGELFNELPEEVRVAVLGELVEHEPVAQLPLGEDEVQRPRHVLVILAADLAVEEAVAHPVEHEGDQAVAEVEHGDGAQEHVPEPKHQVDLLVDDVLGEDAQPVVELQPHSDSNKSAAAVQLSTCHEPGPRQKLRHWGWCSWSQSGTRCTSGSWHKRNNRVKDKIKY